MALGARRDASRLARLGDALTNLAAGVPDVRVAVRGRDPIGLVARMIERTSDVVARDRQRLASLKNLAAWQEAARRQAHELRTPLTVARLELGRVEERLGPEALGGDVGRSLAEVRTEVGRLEQLVQRFATFAKLPAPDRQLQDACGLLRDFAATFADAWPGLALDVRVPAAA